MAVVISSERLHFPAANGKHGCTTCNLPLSHVQLEEWMLQRPCGCYPMRRSVVKHLMQQICRHGAK